MNPHAQQVADLEALTADFYAPRAAPGSRRRPDQIAYALKMLTDAQIMGFIKATHPFPPTSTYARAVGRQFATSDFHHLFVKLLEKDWPDLPTMEMKIARLRHFHSQLEFAW